MRNLLFPTKDKSGKLITISVQVQEGHTVDNVSISDENGVTSIDTQSSLDVLVKEFTDTKTVFSLQVEADFDTFYAYLSEARSDSSHVSNLDSIYKTLLKKYCDSEEVLNVLNLEIRQFRFEQKRK